MAPGVATAGLATVAGSMAVLCPATDSRTMLHNTPPVLAGRRLPLSPCLGSGVGPRDASPRPSLLALQRSCAARGRPPAGPGAAWLYLSMAMLDHRPKSWTGHSVRHEEAASSFRRRMPRLPRLQRCGRRGRVAPAMMGLTHRPTPQQALPEMQGAMHHPRTG